VVEHAQADGRPTGDEPAYVRGAGIAISRARAIRIIGGFVVASLLALTIVLGLQAHSANTRYQRLHSSGVPVAVTVKGCLGVIGGTGVTETYYRCTGTFTYAGKEYTEEILHMPDLHRPGSIVSAVVDPHDVTNLSLASAVAAGHDNAAEYIPTEICLALFVVALAVFTWVAWRRPRT
jgi:hypothetical protein